MDKTGDVVRLSEGAKALGVSLSEGPAQQLLWVRSQLLKWNEKVNLTAITDPDEVLEKHLLDSLAVASELGEARSLVDLGAGAGFPGIPLKILRPSLELTLVETVGKKVAFMKQCLAGLGLRAGAKAVQCRAGGEPEKEGVGKAEAVISRAFMEPREWVQLAVRYALPGGRVIAMLGKPWDSEALSEVAAQSNVRLGQARQYELPWSKAPRSVVVFHVP